MQWKGVSYNFVLEFSLMCFVHSSTLIIFSQMVMKTTKCYIQVSFAGVSYIAEDIKREQIYPDIEYHLVGVSPYHLLAY